MKSVSEEPVPLHEEFIYCCGAATHVLKCGPWKDLSKNESKNLPRLLFMIIPGMGVGIEEKDKILSFCWNRKVARDFWVFVVKFLHNGEDFSLVWLPVSLKEIKNKKWRERNETDCKTFFYSNISGKILIDFE